jgi:hypothetical protein
VTADSFHHYPLPEHPYLSAIHTLQADILRQRAFLVSKRPRGLLAMFYQTQQAAIDQEINYLNQRLVSTHAKQIVFLEKALANLEQSYSFESLQFPPKEKLAAIQTLLSQCEQTLLAVPSGTPKETVLEELAAFKKKFTALSGIATYLVRKLLRGDSCLPVERLTSRAGISVVSYPTSKLEALFTYLKEYVNPAQQAALEGLASLLKGSGDLSLSSLKEKLFPLFESFHDKEAACEQFMGIFLEKYILPTLQDPQSPHFFLLSKSHPKLIEKWLNQKVSTLEAALVFLQTAYSGPRMLDNQMQRIGNQSFCLDKTTLLAHIKLLQSFGSASQTKGFLERFHVMLTHSIQQDSAYLCYYPDHLEGILLLTHDPIKIDYIQALVRSSVANQGFESLEQMGLIDYLNSHSAALASVQDSLLIYFKANQWHSPLQKVLDQLQDPSLAQSYRYLMLQKIMAGDIGFDNPLAIAENDLGKFIGEAHVASFYALLTQILQSDKVLSASQLAVIDQVLSANWPQDITGLQVLFECKRQQVVNQSEVSVGIKEIRDLIKQGYLEEALHKIKEHSLLALGQLDRAFLHAAIVSGVLQALDTLNQADDIPHQTLPDRQALWRFYAGLRQAIHTDSHVDNEAKNQWLASLARIEQHHLALTHPLGYFFKQLMLLDQNNVAASEALDHLLTLYPEIKAHLSPLEDQALSQLFSLLAGDFTVSAVDFDNLLERLLRDLTAYFPLEKMRSLLLGYFVLPYVDSFGHPALPLVKGVDATWWEALVAKEKAKVEESLCLLNTVLLTPSHPEHMVWVNGKAVKPTLEGCLQAIRTIKQFCIHSAALELSTFPDYLGSLTALVSQYIEAFKKKTHDLTFLPLVEALGNDSLLDTYLCSWIEGTLNNQAEVALLQHESILPYLNRPSIQLLLERIVVNSYSIGGKRTITQEERPFSLLAGLQRPALYRLPNQTVFALLDLISPDNKPNLLRQLIPHHTRWELPWHNYLIRFGDLETRQAYCCLFLKNFFSDPNFAKQHADFLPAAQCQDFETAYGEANIPLVLKWMENYLAGRIDENKARGYEFIAFSLADATLAPWQALREKALSHLALLQDRQACEESMSELKDLMAANHYLAVKSKMEHWVMQASLVKPASQEGAGASRLLKAAQSYLKDTLQQLITQKAVSHIAMLRDFILPALLPSEEKAALIGLCNKHSPLLHFDVHNQEIAKLFQQLIPFEQAAWEFLQQSLPHMATEILAGLKKMVSIAKQNQEATLQPLFLRLERGEQVEGVTGDQTAFYRRHRAVIDSVAKALLTAAIYFQEIGRQVASSQPYLKQTGGSRRQIERLQSHFNEQALLWKKKSEFSIPFFAQKSVAVASEEAEWVLIEGDLPAEAALKMNK